VRWNDRLLILIILYDGEPEARMAIGYTLCCAKIMPVLHITPAHPGFSCCAAQQAHAGFDDERYIDEIGAQLSETKKCRSDVVLPIKFSAVSQTESHS
jgi:hypothetical protein